MPARHRDRTDRSIDRTDRSDVSDRTDRSDVSDRTDRDATPIHFYRSRPVRIDLKIFPRERTNANVKIEKNPPRHMSDCSYRGSRVAGSGHRGRDRDIAIWVFRESGPVVYGEGTGFFRPDRSIGSIGSTPARSVGIGIGRACAYESAWIFFTARAPVESRAESARRSIWREKAFEHSGRP